MSAAKRKFLFDTDFAGAADGKPTIPLAEHALKLAEAETAARALKALSITGGGCLVTFMGGGSSVTPLGK